MPETFTDRFNRLTSDLRDVEVASLLDLTEGAVRKLRRGDTQTLKLDAALRLCKRLGISPWELAGEREPSRQDSRAVTITDVRPLTPQGVARIIYFGARVADAFDARPNIQPALEGFVEMMRFAVNERRTPSEAVRAAITTIEGNPAEKELVERQAAETAAKLFDVSPSRGTFIGAFPDLLLGAVLRDPDALTDSQQQTRQRTDNGERQPRFEAVLQALVPALEDLARRGDAPPSLKTAAATLRRLEREGPGAAPSP
ncbi:MAG: hypothetical protein JWM87_659 [Candidatus Eremiobacteraeota bacterium]|nr:hypothetical protein [Candidatus Eremiobacteraeota bacterium]